MNRYDEIKDMAHRIANATCPATGDQEQAANDLIKLITLVVAAVGKGVAVDGETENNDPFSDDEAAHARYITGGTHPDGGPRGARRVGGCGSVRPR